MLTEFKPTVKAILIETLERGIEAIRDGRIGEPCDLGILAKSLTRAIEDRIPESGPFMEFFKAQADGGYVGEYVNPELVAFLIHGADADDSGNADADADADADVGTDLDEANATANAIANESIEFANYSGKVNISQDALRGLVESRTAIDAEPEPVL